MKNILPIVGIIALLVYPAISEEMPNDISFGYGAHHGGLGVKYVGNNVVMVSAGVFDDLWMYEVGIQFPFKITEMQGKKWVNTSYFTASYGGIGTKEDFYTEYTTWGGTEYKTDKQVIMGCTLLYGYLFNLGSESRLFIDAGAGYSFGKVTFFKGTDYEMKESINAFTFDAGIGVRF